MKTRATIFMMVIMVAASVQSATASVLKDQIPISLKAAGPSILRTGNCQCGTQMEVSMTVASKDIAPPLAGQTSPTNTQNQSPSTHHSHHLRNLVIIVVALTVGCVILAAQDK
ncbi:hypothetical protein [Pseudacidobacterium ailaaui]|uniref:hypothetical protein n=1 Tax=Pseudacidobacterium ailaaui TaxID=1382359 RepID=UPI0012DC6745|nr:hypothetical protein [Pseudacidobacterium ailaaui]MBX6360633.1 hypothetical protein [Pseudacidobacterium ailaaui]